MTARLAIGRRVGVAIHRTAARFGVLPHAQHLARRVLAWLQSP